LRFRSDRGVRHRHDRRNDYSIDRTKWAVDLPAGSIGRLLDLYNTDQYAVDKGRYYTVGLDGPTVR
jgi:hypothetical protein